MTNISEQPRSRFRSALSIVGLLVLAALALWTIDRVMRTRAIAEAGSLASDDAAILSSGLQSELDKFTLVPLVLAEDPQVQQFLAGDLSQRAAMNGRMETLARQTNAAAIYLMDDSGEALAASNWNLPTSFVGSNYGFRGYFQTAMREGSATQFALGTVSRRPGLYVAQRVGPADAPIGMIAVKVEFDALEASWRNATDGVFVTDSDGVVLLASNDDWRFRAAQPDALENRDAAADQQQFGISTLEPLSITPNSPRGGVITAPLLDTEQPIALDGWRLHLLVDPSPRVEAAIANGRLLLLILMGLMTALYAAWVYRRRQRSIAEDAIVGERTRMLREQLTQANRLATLGQVSAGVAHEISQPIAAARVLAENGEKLIKSGRNGAASDNFAKIIDLTERIGLITGELRRFSRRQPAEPKAMQVDQAINSALLLLRDRIDSLGIRLRLPDQADAQVTVQAEHVRLEQVLVNLIQNAIDATGKDGQITIAIQTGAKNCALTVSDNGPGIDPLVAEQLFQPFATTKPNGLGLGLVISRDIMRELGGDLSVTSTTDGARFTMCIPRQVTAA